MPVVRIALMLSMLPIAVVSAAGQQRSDTTAAQVGSGDRSAPPPASQITAPRDARRPVDQVQAPAKPGTATPQITRETRRATGSPQLGKAERSARGSESLSRRSDGRQTALVRLGGSDRCDPQAPASETPACKTVIETRSAEFTRPAATVLSPEQRLLLDRERAETGGVRSAIQRVGRNDIDTNALDTQTLAALTLGSRPADTPLPAKDDTPAEAAIDSIIQIINAAQAAAPK